MQHRTVLACTATTAIRNPQTGALWYPHFSPDTDLLLPEWAGSDPAVVATAILLNLTLAIPEKFTGRYSYETRQFSIHSLGGYLWNPISDQHWKVEAKRLFTTRLARLQMDIVGVAQGLGHDLPGAVDELARRGLSDTCQHIKYQAQGRRNISLVGLVGLLLLSFFTWLCTIQVNQTVAVIWFTEVYIAPGLVLIGQSLVRLWNAMKVLSTYLPTLDRILALSTRYLDRMRWGGP